MKTLQISLLSLLMLLMSHLDIVGQEHGHKCCSKDHYVCSRYQSKLLKFSNVKENPNPKEVVTKSSCGYTAISQLASLSAPDLFNWLIGTTDVDCVYHPLVAYNPTYSSQVFSDANVTYITTNAINFLNGYDGQNNNGVRGIFRYLALAEFQKVSGNISWNAATLNSIRTAIVAFMNNPNSLNNSKVTMDLVADIMYVAAEPSINADPIVLAYAEDMAINATNNSFYGTQDNHSYYVAYYYLTDYYYRYATDNPIFISHLQSNPSFINAIRDMINNTAFDASVYQHFSDIRVHSIQSLGRFLKNDASLKSQVEPALNSVVNNYAQYSETWINAALELIDNGCNFPFTAAEIYQNLENSVLPYTYSFNDGKFQVSTPLSYQEILEIYEASEQVKAQFFRLLETDVPVAGDVNEVLHMKVYGTRDDYARYNGILFGVDYPNSGGIYIEDGATFYTYQRTPQESTYSLEELFRHEYTHYLQGRYLAPGNWGNSPIYDNSRLVWFEEGMAQFFMGSTEYNDVRDLNVVLNSAASLGPLQSISDIFNASYTGDFNTHYIYSPILWSYWYKHDRGRFKELFDYLRASNLSGFDSVVNYFRNSSAENSNYINHANSLIGNSSTWFVPQTDALLYDNMHSGDVNQLASELEAAVPGLTVSTATKSELIYPRRFELTGQFTAQTNRSSNASASLALNDELNHILQTVKNSSSLNNFNYAVGYFENVSNTAVASATFHIMGPLNDDGTTTTVYTHCGIDYTDIALFQNAQNNDPDCTGNTGGGSECGGGYSHCGEEFGCDYDAYLAAYNADPGCSGSSTGGGNGSAYSHCGVGYDDYDSYLAAYNNDPGCTGGNNTGGGDGGNSPYSHCGTGYDDYDSYIAAYNADPSCNGTGFAYTHCGIGYHVYENYIDAFNADPSCQNAILPVVLLNFTGQYNSDNFSNQISWKVSQEIAMNAYELERTHESEVNFTAINSTSAIGKESYDFEDNNIKSATGYFYRLKMISEDGSYEYSDIIYIQTDFISQPPTVDVFPNPTSEKFTLQVVNGQEAQIEIYNLSGKKINVTAEVISDGSYEMNTSGLENGMYLLRVTIGENEIIKKLNVIK